MTTTIFKYDLQLIPHPQQIKLSKGARILSTGFQIGPEGWHMLRMWALVDPYAQEHETAVVLVIPTGMYMVMSEGFTLLGRADYPGMVVHVFYKVMTLENA